MVSSSRGLIYIIRLSIRYLYHIGTLYSSLSDIGRESGKRRMIWYKEQCTSKIEDMTPIINKTQTQAQPLSRGFQSLFICILDLGNPMLLDTFLHLM